MKKSVWITGAVLGVALLGFGARHVMAEAGGGLGGRAFRDGPLGRLMVGNLGRFMTLRSELDLSEEQKSQIKSVVQNHRSEIVEVARQFKVQATAVKTAVRADGADEAAIRAATDGLAQTLGDAAVLASQLRREVEVCLTEEQRSKVSEFHDAVDKATDKLLEEAAKP